MKYENLRSGTLYVVLDRCRGSRQSLLSSVPAGLRIKTRFGFDFKPEGCFSDYPWRPPSSNVDSNVVKWLFLPDYMTPPNPLFLLCKIIADFIKPHKAILLKEGGHLCSPGRTCTSFCFSRWFPAAAWSFAAASGVWGGASAARSDPCRWQLWAWGRRWTALWTNCPASSQHGPRLYDVQVSATHCRAVHPIHLYLF